MSVNQPFIHHVHELRRRLMWSALVLMAGAALGYWQRGPLLLWLAEPLHQELYYTKVTGAFEFIMQACLLVGILAATPMIVYQLLAFIQPALPRPIRRRSMATIIFTAMLLAITGTAFGYYLSLPMVLHFLASLDPSVHPIIAADSYLRFVMIYLAVFAIMFELPLVLVSIDRITPLPPASLRKWRKWVIAGAFGVALILPVAPDPVSQAMMAIPVVVLYQISIWILTLVHHRRGKYVLQSAPQVAEADNTVPAPVERPVATPRPRRAPAYQIGPQVIDLRQYKQP